MESCSEIILRMMEKHVGDKNFKIRNGQVITKSCPFCNGGDSGADEWTFAVNLYNGAFNCKRGSCSVKGGLSDLAAHFGEHVTRSADERISMPQKKTLVKPSPSILHPLTTQCEMYFALRNIGRETLDAFNVSSDDKGNIIFPFYRGETLTYVKYRPPVKDPKSKGMQKEWQMADTEEILFGFNKVSYNTPIVITEGMMDALAVYESGYSNVVSVPAGCDHYGWLENQWKELEECSQFILFGDNDDCGRIFMDTVAKRLGEDRCKRVPEYPSKIVNNTQLEEQCKDANEILMSWGPEKIIELIENSELPSVKGIIDLGKIPDFDITTIPRIYSKIDGLDKSFGGFAEGEVTVVSGKRGSGKSTIGGVLLLNAIEQGYKVAAYSGELSANMFSNWIFLQACESDLIGVKADPHTGKNLAIISTEIKQRIQKWLEGKFFLFDNNEIDGKAEGDAVLDVFVTCVRRYGCKMFLVDNMMTMTQSADEENKAQAKFMGALKNFAKKYKVHVLVVCHPRKSKAGEAFTNDDVSG